MHGEPRNGYLRGAQRFFAMLLAILILTPACSAICQARTCQLPQMSQRDSSCHHADNMTSDHALGLAAAPSSCGLRDLLFVLPVSPDNLQMKFARARWIDSFSLFNDAYTIASRSSGPGLPRDAGPAHRMRKLTVPAFSFDSFLSLRI